MEKLSEEEQTRALSSEDHLIEALIAQPSLIKRPVLQTSKGYLVGFDETISKLKRIKTSPLARFYLSFSSHESKFGYYNAETPI